MLQRKEMLNAQPVTVFQKGSHKAIVADAVNNKSKSQSQSPSVNNTRSNSPTRPPSVASSR